MWSPQEGPQLDAIQATWCEEMLFGGSRGGGKSDFLLGDFLSDVDEYKDAWRGILFRRSYPELQELMHRSHEIYSREGGSWKEADKTWTWPNGATLKMRYIERYADTQNYQGHQYTWIGWDEVSNWSDMGIYKALLATLRSSRAVSTKRVRATGNPGGAGHQWVKEYFIDHAPAGYVPRLDERTKHNIMFIPSKVTDNRILMENDPGYIDRLKGVGSPELVRAWLEGDWNAVVGSYFTELTPKHYVEPFKIPDNWMRFKAFDWGSYRPFCVLWFAVPDTTTERWKPTDLLVYKEWYGAKSANVGLKLSVGAIAHGIKQREKGETITYSVADPSIFKEDGGPSIAEDFAKNGVLFRRADNARISGWQQIRNRLIGEDGRPSLYFVANQCPNLLRTLPALQHDQGRPDDLDSDGEDHAADTLRYGVLSRPFSLPVVIPEVAKTLYTMTINELWQEHDHSLGAQRTKRI